MVRVVDVPDHAEWHQLDMAVDVMAEAHIENLIERVFRLEGGDPRLLPLGPSASDVFNLALEIFPPEGVARWVASPTDEFGGRSPGQAMSDGEVANVYDSLVAVRAGIAAIPHVDGACAACGNPTLIRNTPYAEGGLPMPDVPEGAVACCMDGCPAMYQPIGEGE